MPATMRQKEFAYAGRAAWVLAFASARNICAIHLKLPRRNGMETCCVTPPSVVSAQIVCCVANRPGTERGCQKYIIVVDGARCAVMASVSRRRAWPGPCLAQSTTTNVRSCRRCKDFIGTCSAPGFYGAVCCSKHPRIAPERMATSIVPRISRGCRLLVSKERTKSWGLSIQWEVESHFDAFRR